MRRLFASVYPRALIITLLLLSCLAFQVSLESRFDHDEFEHIHAAWYLTQGELPYRDFFENHHPLFWYLLAPVIRISGENTQTIILIRIFMWALMMATAAVVYLIGQESTRSKETGLLAATLLLSSLLFVNKALEVRPDAPQVFCGLVSVYFVSAFLRTREPKMAFYAGIAASLSFIFLQKALFLFFAYAIMFAVLIFRRRLAPKELIPFVVGSALPLALFVLWLLSNGLWGDYVLSNWLLHANKESAFESLKHMKRSLGYNGLWWVAALAFAAMALIDKRMDERLRWIAFLAGFSFLKVFVMPHQYAQYFLLSTALFSVGAAVALNAGMQRVGCKQGGKALVIVLLSFFHILAIQNRLLSDEERGRHRRQLDRIAFVLAGTDEEDALFDGNSDFNLFRPDLHYFWHSIGDNKGLDIYNRLAGGRFKDYDSCALIREQRPKFISNYHLDLEACGLHEIYQPTRFNKVFMRN